VLFHSLRQGSFRLSLTVLVHYRSSGPYLALESGLPRFPQGSTCLMVLRIPLPYYTHSAYRTITPYGRPFHASSAICVNWYSRGPTTPNLQHNKQQNEMSNFKCWILN